MANAGVGAGRSRRWGPIWKGKFVVTKLPGRYLSGAAWFWMCGAAGASLLSCRSIRPTSIP
jgi:hypothetical protein